MTSDNQNRIGWYWHNGHQKHADVSPKVGIRVQEGGPGFEWSVWVGEWRARVMHASGYTRTRLGAERAAVRKGRKLAERVAS